METGSGFRIYHSNQWKEEVCSHSRKCHQNFNFNQNSSTASRFDSIIFNEKWKKPFTKMNRKINGNERVDDSSPL